MVLRATVFGQIASAGALVLLACGCKVVSIDRDRAMRERRDAGFDATRYVDRNWGAHLLPAYTARSVPAAELLSALKRDARAADAAYGRRAAEGADWTFVVRGQGHVVSVDAASRAGTVTVAVNGAGDVRLLTGPVLVSTALRDAAPDLRFDDFTDQLAFAALNKAVNDKALAATRPIAASLRPGDSVSFMGAAQVADPGDPLSVVPVSLRRETGGS